MSFPQCPKCASEFTYQDGLLFICPECSYEWSEENINHSTIEDVLIVKDAHGNQLSNGDTVSIIKDLPVKGSSFVIKVGVKVKNIKLVEGDHNIDCKIEGIGAMKLKSQYVKKA